MKHVNVSPLAARIPLHVPAGVWTTVVVDCANLAAGLFGSDYLGIDSVSVSPFCSLLRLFTLLDPPMPTIELFNNHMRPQSVGCPPDAPAPLPKQVSMAGKVDVIILDTSYARYVTCL
ncbi:cilia/flagella-associated protein 20/WDR90/C3orf67 [Kipferlia bialata]|nr:cilia/flagella-associated protein 20/WDR90/C3orf67 [Kipferlia bialata]|eukprot:g485.t1